MSGEQDKRNAAWFERVFREHHAMVFRAACRVTGNTADAEDVLQTVFLRLLGRGEADTVMENAEHYLRRAAVNGALDVIRARASRRWTPRRRWPPRARRARRNAWRGRPRFADGFARP